jgi:hypothetical protein
MTPTGLVLLTTLILAQTGRPPLLAGPRVTAQAATDRASVFNASARPRPASIGPRRWLRLLKQVDLDAEQRVAIQGIVADFRQATEAFRDEHGDRLDTLRSEASAARKTGVVPPEARRRELSELYEKRPKGADYLKRIWVLLDERQQQQVRELLAEARQARAEQKRNDSKRPDHRPVPPRP